MARAIRWDALRSLAAVEAVEGRAISLYLNLDPTISPTAGDAATRLNSLLDEGAKSDAATADDLSHDQRQALRADFERIRRFYEQDFVRDGARGLAVFCSGLDDVWETLSLVDTVPDDVRVDRRLYLAPLAPLVGRGEGALVVVASREQGRFYRLADGRLEEVTNLSEERPRRHDQGGWSQARYQRHVDELAADHVRTVAEEIDRLVRRRRGAHVVIVAPEETRAELSDHLSQEVRNVLAGWTHAEAHAAPAELLEAALPVLEGRRADEERELAERWREEAGRNGRAASGWGDTLAAASEGRIDVLLFEEGADRTAWRCPECGRASAEAGTCPLDGSALERAAKGIDLAVQQTLVHGGTVRALRHAHDLDPVDGIGALLRY